jgi:hypothetical protein
MPEISRFFGIIITMNYSDHAPRISTCATLSKRRWLASSRWPCYGDAFLPVFLAWLWSGQPFTRLNCWRTGAWRASRHP